MRALLRWVVLIVLLSGAGLLAGRRGTGAFVLSGVTLGIGILAGAVLIVLIRFSRPE